MSTQPPESNQASAAPALRGYVTHSPDSTVITDTSREDRDLAAIVKAAGFRWSRDLGAWYLPRTWSQSTRLGRVLQISQQLPDQITIEVSHQPRRPAAEREAETRERAAARAIRLDERADRSDQVAIDADRARRRIQDGIPLGQPILSGHHSEARHRSDIDKMDRNMRRSIDADQAADNARAGADRARAVAAGRESVVTIGNRIERLTAEIRHLERCRDGSGLALHGEDTPAQGAHRTRLQASIDDLSDQLAHNQTKLTAAGGIPHSKATVSPGDLVRVRGTWYPVVRANTKTVSIPNACLPATSKSSDTTPWREVQQHLPRAQATTKQVCHLANTTSRGFPGIRDRLIHYAQTLETDAGDGQVAEDGQTEGTR